MAINTVINTNMMALTSHRALSSVGNRQAKASQRLSTGKKINSAADDAAGLAISEKMKAQIKGLDMASKNSQDAISLIQTAEGALTEVNDMLTRVRELTVQAANDTNQKEDRVKIAEEVGSLLTEIDSISGRTEFNEKKLNDGSFQNGFFQIGANKGQKLDLGIGNMSVSGIGANGIREAFGLNKKVELAPESSSKGAIVSDGKKATITTNITGDTTVGGTGNNGKALTAGGTVEMKVMINGKADTLKFDVDLSNVTLKSDGAVDSKVLAAEVANQLNKNEEFSKNFIAKGDATTGTFSITAKEVGGDIIIGDKDGKLGAATDIQLKLNAGGEAGVPDATKKLDLATANQQTGKGDYGVVDVSKLKEGDTVTIGGKKYTMVSADKVDSTYGGFSDEKSLVAALQNDGLNVTLNAKQITLNYASQNTPLAGKYTVDPAKVSDKGADYSKTIETVDNALKAVTTQRSKLGANQNRLEHTINNLSLSSENLSAAKSRIEDTDMAKEMMNLTSANVLQQAATSMLAQANQAPNKITQLLG